MSKLAQLANRFLAATKLAPAAPIKPPKSQQSYPGYRTQVSASASALAKPERRLANTDLLSYRTSPDTKKVIRDLSISSPDLSATLSAYLRVGIPEEYTVVGYSMDGEVSENATQLAHEILRRMTYVPDYNLGFNAFSSVHALSCSLGKQFMLYGSASMEVVLDKSRLPTQMVPVHTPSLTFYEDDLGMRPVQKVGGEEIDLDIPTFIYGSIDQDLTEPYSSSPFESAIQAVLADADFTNDLRRVLKRAIHPRVMAVIIEEKLKKATPIEVLNDPSKHAAFLSSVLQAVQDNLTGLEPEDAIVSFDSVEHSVLENRNAGDISGTLKAVQDLLNSKLATGAKTLPAILGHGDGGNHASTESMLFVKSADVVRRGLNDLYSRALTVAVRLFGEDAYIEFKYATIDLRPDSELEAYKAMKQSRILELLSLGLISDMKASIELTGNLPPQGMAPLSGTMFKTGSTGNAGANPDSNTSAMNQTLKPKTPASPKSPTK